MREYKDGKLIDNEEPEAISPEQAREQFNIINQPSKDYSKASESKINTPDEDTAKLRALSEVLGVSQQREEIDKLNQSMTYLAQKMNEIALVVDKQSAIIQSGVTPQAAPPQNDSMQKLEHLGTLAENLGPLLERIFPKHDVTQPLIDNNIIQEKMKQTFFDNLETGESINNFIKNSLKKSVTKNVINTSLKDIGQANQVNTHEPA
jgi:uncharacterized coiled-coil protein SlyX